MIGVWTAPSIRGTQDTKIYQSIGEDINKIASGEDIKMDSEYPPLASSLFYIAESNPFELPFEYAWIILIALVIAMCCIYVYRNGDPPNAFIPAAATTLTAIFLGRELVFARFDIFVMAMLFLCWYSFRIERYRSSAFFLILAGCLKLVPLALLPILWFSTDTKHKRDLIIGSILGIVFAVVTPALFIGIGTTIDNINYFVNYHSSRGVQVESTWSGLNILLNNFWNDVSKISFHALSAQNTNLGKGTLIASFALFILGLCTACISVFKLRKRGEDPFTIPFLLLILWILGVSPILSPQFLVWIVPIVAVWMIEQSRKLHQIDANRIQAILALSGICIATQWIFPYHYTQFLDQDSIINTIVLNIRNGCIFWLIWLLYKQIRPKRSKRNKLYSYIKRKHTKKSFIVDTCIFVAGIITVSILNSQISPNIGNATYQFEGHEKHETTLPFFAKTESEKLFVDFTMELSELHPTKFRIKPDDCIEEMIVNKKKVTESLFCDYSDGRVISFADQLKPGKNTFHVVIKDTGVHGGMRIQTARSDQLSLIILIFFAALILWYGTPILLRINKRMKYFWIVLLILGGSFLRFYYMDMTTYTVRGHDTDAHIDYIEYVADNMKIPPAQEKWEYHQPPLYYFVTGSLMKLGRSFDLQKTDILDKLQLLSLFFSLLVLGIGIWIGLILFKEEEHKQRLQFGCIISVFPILILLTSRITNDTLFQVISFLFAAILLLWWKNGYLREWLLLLLIISIGLLTKISALAFLAIGFLTALIRKDVHPKEKIAPIIISLIFVLLIAGWLPILRLAEQERSRTLSLGNEGMHGKLQVENTWQNFTTFNPYQMLNHPYNNPWNDESRRQYFWEYFFRSAFTGQFSFEQPIKTVTVLLLICGLFMIPLMLWGIFKEVRSRPYDTFPMLLLLCVQAAASFGYRYFFAYAPNQDFRFSIILIIPIAYFVIRGAQHLSGKLQKNANRIIGAYCILNAVFILLIYFD